MQSRPLPEIDFWGISPMVLRQKAHSGLIIMADGLRDRSNMLLNQFSFSQLREGRNLQRFHRDTATLVHTHHAEDV
jgi:hypothetical protein